MRTHGSEQLVIFDQTWTIIERTETATTVLGRNVHDIIL